MLRVALLLLAALLLFGSIDVGDSIGSSPSLPASTAPPTETDPAGPLAFGSQALLDRCWPAEALQGKPGENRPLSCTPSAPLSPPGFPATELPPLPRELQGSIRSVTLTGSRKAIALTFDLCEGPHELAGYDAAVVETLRKYRVKATFFAGGRWMASHPERTWQLMADPLFEIGNHTWSHANCRVLSEAEIEEQVLWTQAEYERLRSELEKHPCTAELDPVETARIPRVPRVFRFPFGTCSDKALNLLARHGLAAIQWSIVTGDPAENQTAAGIVRIVASQARPGAIVIGHANGRGHGTAEALQVLIPKLRAQGFEFVTVSELLQLGSPVAVGECYELAPGDNRQYDKRFGRK